MLKLGKIIIVTITVLLLIATALFACGKKEEPQPQAQPTSPSTSSPMMSGHGGGTSTPPGAPPHGMGMPGGTKVERKVVVPKEVAGAWKGVKITVSEKKSGGKSNTYTINLNESFTVPGSKLTLKVDTFLPNFTMGGEITSASNEPRNPACHMIISEGGKESQSWFFANFPDMHPFEHPQYKVILVGGVPKG